MADKRGREGMTPEDSDVEPTERARLQRRDRRREPAMVVDNASLKRVHQALAARRARRATRGDRRQSD